MTVWRPLPRATLADQRLNTSRSTHVPSENSSRNTYASLQVVQYVRTCEPARKGGPWRRASSAGACQESIEAICRILSLFVCGISCRFSGASTRSWSYISSAPSFRGTRRSMATLACQVCLRVSFCPMMTNSMINPNKLPISGSSISRRHATHHHRGQHFTAPSRDVAAAFVNNVDVCLADNQESCQRPTTTRSRVGEQEVWLLTVAMRR